LGLLKVSAVLLVQIAIQEVNVSRHQAVFMGLVLEERSLAIGMITSLYIRLPTPVELMEIHAHLTQTVGQEEFVSKVQAFMGLV